MTLLLEVLLMFDLQDGEPYIISNTARKVLNTSSPLSEGFTLASQSIFKNHADHDFYDKQCPAHKKLKVVSYHSLAVKSLSGSC